MGIAPWRSCETTLRHTISESGPIPTVEIICPARQTTDSKNASANAHRPQKPRNAKKPKRSAARKVNPKRAEVRKTEIPTDATQTAEKRKEKGQRILRCP